MNFRREGTVTHKCVEGWSNTPVKKIEIKKYISSKFIQHEKFLFKTQPNRDNKMKKLNEEALVSWKKPNAAWQRTEARDRKKANEILFFIQNQNMNVTLMQGTDS